MTMHPETHVEERTSARVIRSTFGVAQGMSMLWGVGAVVAGGVGLARTGWADITEEVVVGPWRLTGILALALLGLGIIGLLSSIDNASARGHAFVAGTILIAGSLIMLIADLEALASDPTVGVTLLLVGVTLLGAGLVSSGSTIEEREVSIDRMH